MYTGLTGKVTVGSGANEKTIAYISNWSIESTTTVLEAAELGKSYKTKLAGVQSWSATAEGAIDFADAGQSAIFAAKENGTSVTCRFYLNADATPPVYLEGAGFIETMSIGLSSEDKGTISITVSGTGLLKKYPETVTA